MTAMVLNQAQYDALVEHWGKDGLEQRARDNGFDGVYVSDSHDDQEGQP